MVDRLSRHHARRKLRRPRAGSHVDAHLGADADARAVANGDLYTGTAAQRARRQKRLEADNPLQLSAIMDESAIRRVIGGLETTRDQLQHLIDMSQLPNVTIQVLPSDAGEHPFLGGPAALLEFRETTHLDVVYLEGLAGDYYEEQPSEVARYREHFERLIGVRELVLVEAGQERLLQNAGAERIEFVRRKH